MAFSFTLVSDNFTRANSASLGANWTAFSDARDTTTFKIASNNATLTTINQVAASYWNANSFTNDQFASAVANAGPFGVIVRATPGGNYYGGTASGNFGAIHKVVNGVFTALTGNIAVTTNDGMPVQLEVKGTLLSLYINGNLVTSVNDSTFASGSPGLVGFGNASTYTTWRGGDLLWTRKGAIITPTQAGPEGSQEPKVIYDTNPQILTANGDGKIWKMWFGYGWTTVESEYYAESNDAVTWTLLPRTTSAIASDTFTRADENPLNATNWTAESGATSGSPFKLVSNAATPSSGTNNAASFWAANSFTNDQYGQVTVATTASPGSTVGGGVVLRAAGSDNYYRVFANFSTGVQNLSIAKVVNGTFTALSANVPVTLSTSGAVIRGEIVGTTIYGYVNGVVITSVSDGALTSGAVGICGYNGSLSATLTNWTGGNITAAGNPVISPAVHGAVCKIGSTYYGFFSPTASFTAFDRWTSSDGVAWTKTHTAVLSKGSGFESANVSNPKVWAEGATWYMLYSGGNGVEYQNGLATSTDLGITWTKYGGNPVIQANGGAGTIACCEVQKISGTYFAIGQYTNVGNTPGDLNLYTSTDLHTWTPSPKNPILIRETSGEGAGLSSGQLADPCLVELNGTIYLFDDAIDIQSAGHSSNVLRTMPQTMSDYLYAAAGLTPPIVSSSVVSAGMGIGNMYGLTNALVRQV